MATIHQSKLSANKFWTDIIYKNHPVEGPPPLLGPKYLWDARVTSSMDFTDTSVTEWRDIVSGLALNQYFGVDLSKAPTYLEDELGGEPALNFNGVNNYLASQSFVDESTNFTFMVVVGNFQTNLDDSMGGIIQSFFNNNYLRNGYINDGQVHLDGNTFEFNLASLPVQALAWRVTEDGTSVEFWSNGGSSTIQEMSPPLGSGIQFMSIGSAVGTNYLDGSIAWIAYWDTALSDGDLTSAFNYVSGVYGMSVSPVIPD